MKPALNELSHHTDHRIRTGACHLLGLTGLAAVLPIVSARLDNAEEKVREIAQGALEKPETAS